MCFVSPEVGVRREAYRFGFGPEVSLKDIEETLFLAVTSTGGIHGEARVRLEGDFRLCEEQRTVALDATTRIGQDLARIFTRLLMAQFGEESFNVERVPAGPEAPPAAATAGVRR